MPSPGEKNFINLCTDIILLVLVFLPVIILFFVGRPYIRGYFCNDTNVRYPFRYSTLPSGLVLPIFLAIPILTILLIEYLHMRKCAKTACGKDRILIFLSFFGKFFKVFLFGLGLSLLTVMLFKFTIGRLRPHFIDVCNPDPQLTNCSVGAEVFVAGDVCQIFTDEDESLIREARLSFMSGRASVAAYAMTFVALYLQYRLNVPHHSLLRPFLQFASLALAFLVAALSISDYQSHWSDVLAGFLNGIIFAAFSIFVISSLRKRTLINIQLCKSNAHQIALEKDAAKIS